MSERGFHAGTAGILKETHEIRMSAIHVELADDGEIKFSLFMCIILGWDAFLDRCHVGVTDDFSSELFP